MRANVMVALFSCLALASFLCFAQSLPRAERPEFKLGDTWTYQATDLQSGTQRPEVSETMSEIHTDKVVAVTSSGNRLIYNRDLNLMEVRRGEAPTYAAKPYRPRYKFPMEVGQKWEAHFEYFTRGGQQNYRAQHVIQVVAFESITVSAGTFEAFKIEIRGHYQGTESPRNWTGTFNQTLWYAPHARATVKGQTEDKSGPSYSRETFELKSLKLNQ